MIEHSTATIFQRGNGNALTLNQNGSGNYALEVTGRSTSRHRGSTTLTSDTRAVLSATRLTR